MKFDQYGKRGRKAVPCATCGTPSTSWFADGSPSWPGHSHAADAKAPSPYYSDDLVTIYHADYRTIDLPVADVVVMDPPFDLWPDIDASIDGHAVIAFTTWHYREDVQRLYGKPRTELIWAFADGRWVSHTLPRITHETVLVFGKTRSAYVGPSTDGVPVRKGTGSIGRDKMGPRTYTPHDRKSLDSVMHFPRDVGSDLGVWSKPLGMLSRLIEWCAPGGGLVVDPFAGSGTSLVAAKALGLRSIGVEVDERHCEIAANRCRQEVLGLLA